MIFHTEINCEQALMGIKQTQTLSVAVPVSSFAYLYTHLNWEKIDLEDMWFGNLI